MKEDTNSSKASAIFRGCWSRKQWSGKKWLSVAQKSNKAEWEIGWSQEWQHYKKECCTINHLQKGMLHNHLQGQKFIECKLSVLCSTKLLGCWQCTRDCSKSRAYCSSESRYKHKTLWVFHSTRCAIFLNHMEVLPELLHKMVGNIPSSHTLFFVFYIYLQYCNSYSKKDLTDDVKAKKLVTEFWLALVLSGERSHSDKEEVRACLCFQVLLLQGQQRKVI